MTTLCIHDPCEHQNPDTAHTCQACGKPLRVHNQFRPVNLLGAGGFGRTFRAIDEGKPSRPYRVIKRLIFNNEALRQESIQYFQQEAEHLERLGDDPQIPDLIWNGQEDGYYYIVQEYIDGQNLAQELKESGPFNEEKIWQVLEELLPLLQRLKNVQVIHRDIKPANIIRRRYDRRLVLVDFGAVKVATQTALAKTGKSIIGSAEFAAPEQLRGKPEFASDLYSLGVTCLYLITRISPFELYSDRQGEWVWRDFLPPGQRISPKLGQILDQLIAQPLGKRFASAQEVLTAIHPPPPPPKPAEPKRPEPRPYKEPERKKPLNLDPTAGGRLGRASGSSLAPGWKIDRRAFIGLGVLAFAGVVGRQWWVTPKPPRSGASLGPVVNTTASETEPTPECGSLDNPIQNSDVVAGLRSESYRVQTVINLDSSGQGGQQIDRTITRWVEDLGNGVLLYLVRIPAGTFTMGSPDSEAQRYDDEGPQHQVYVPEFWMGQFEVTQAQYERITGQNPASFQGSENPVDSVSWDNAVDFCEALSQRTGRSYGLPSEAQWEYACRACTQTPFHFGETITPDLVNYNSNYPYANAPKGQYREETTPVGNFPPNPWGLHDMHGNLWEWCADQYYENYNQKPDALKQDGSIAWTQENTNIPPSNSDYHRLRGGSWYGIARVTRSALRSWRSVRNVINGFRVLLSSRTP